MSVHQFQNQQQNDDFSAEDTIKLIMHFIKKYKLWETDVSYSYDDMDHILSQSYPEYPNHFIHNFRQKVDIKYKKLLTETIKESFTKEGEISDPNDTNKKIAFFKIKIAPDNETEEERRARRECVSLPVSNQYSEQLEVCFDKNLQFPDGSTFIFHQKVGKKGSVPIKCSKMGDQWFASCVSCTGKCMVNNHCYEELVDESETVKRKLVNCKECEYFFGMWTTLRKAFSAKELSVQSKLQACDSGDVRTARKMMTTEVARLKNTNNENKRSHLLEAVIMFAIGRDHGLAVDILTELSVTPSNDGESKATSLNTATNDYDIDNRNPDDDNHPDDDMDVHVDVTGELLAHSSDATKPVDAKKKKKTLSERLNAAIARRTPPPCNQANEVTREKMNTKELFDFISTTEEKNKMNLVCNLRIFSKSVPVHDCDWKKRKETDPAIKTLCLSLAKEAEKKKQEDNRDHKEYTVEDEIADRKQLRNLMKMLQLGISRVIHRDKVHQYESINSNDITGLHLLESQLKRWQQCLNGKTPSCPLSDETLVVCKTAFLQMGWRQYEAFFHNSLKLYSSSYLKSLLAKEKDYECIQMKNIIDHYKYIGQVTMKARLDEEGKFHFIINSITYILLLYYTLIFIVILFNTNYNFAFKLIIVTMIKVVYEKAYEEDIFASGTFATDETEVKMGGDIYFKNSKNNKLHIQVGCTDQQNYGGIYKTSTQNPDSFELHAILAKKIGIYIFIPTCGGTAEKFTAAEYASINTGANDIMKQYGDVSYFCTVCGCIVQGLASDGASINTKVMTNLFDLHAYGDNKYEKRKNNTIDHGLCRVSQYYPLHYYEFACLDMPHSIKAIRNALLKNNIKLIVNSQESEGKKLVTLKLDEIYDKLIDFAAVVGSIDSRSNKKLLEALQLACAENFNRNGCKMKVGLATKIFSNTLQDKLEILSKYEMELAEAVQGEEDKAAKIKAANEFNDMVLAFKPFQQALNDGFDAWNNINHDTSTKGNKSKKLYTLDNDLDVVRLERIEKMYTTLNDLQTSGQEYAKKNNIAFNLGKEWLAGVTMTNLNIAVYGGLGLMQHIKDKFSIKIKMYANQLSSDICERIFGNLKSRIQGNSLTIYDFKNLMRIRESYSRQIKWRRLNKRNDKEVLQFLPRRQKRRNMGASAEPAPKVGRNKTNCEGSDIGKEEVNMPGGIYTS